MESVRTLAFRIDVKREQDRSIGGFDRAVAVTGTASIRGVILEGIGTLGDLRTVGFVGDALTVFVEDHVGILITIAVHRSASMLDLLGLQLLRGAAPPLAGDVGRRSGLAGIPTRVAPAGAIDRIPLPSLGTGLAGEDLHLGSEVGRDIHVDGAVKGNDRGILVDRGHRERLVGILTAPGRDVEHAGSTGDEHILGAVRLGRGDLDGTGGRSVILDIVAVRLRNRAGRVSVLSVDHESALQRVGRDGRIGFRALEDRRLAGSENETGDGSDCEV